MDLQQYMITIKLNYNVAERVKMNAVKIKIQEL